MVRQHASQAWMIEMRGRTQTRIGLILLSIALLQILPFASASPSDYSKDSIIVTPQDCLQNIIDNAPEYATIYLSPGTYTEQFTINKPLTLRGHSKETTHIIVTTKQNKPAITISETGATLQNLSITNNGPGIYTTGVRIIASQTTIYNCHFYNTPVGIALWSSNNTITYTSFTNCTDEGIVLLSSSYQKADNNTIQFCTFTNNCDGIELQKSSYNTITNCLFKQNTHDGIDAIGNDNNHNIIANCTILDNNVHGIYFSQSNNNRIQNCIISNNTDGNVYFMPNSPTNTIEFTSSSPPLSSPQTTQIIQKSMQKQNKTVETLKQQILTRIFSFILTFHPMFAT